MKRNNRKRTLLILQAKKCGVNTIKTDDNKMRKYFSFLVVSLMLCSLQSIADPCTSITTIICGTPISFTPASGLGDPNYPATTVCGGTTTQGGLENIYKFIAPSTGTYQFDVTSAANTNSVEYGYKIAATCNWTGWSCLGIMTATGTIDAINLNAGDSIFILVNARTTSTTNQTFQINCAIPFACTSISTISSCGVPITFAPASGLGDPNYPATTACGGTTTQGGLESIYKFIAPATDAYQLYVTSTANSNNVEYGYKTTAPCNWTGWNCLGIMSAVGVIDTLNLNTGDSIFILANSRTTSTTSQAFKINCLFTTDIIDNQTLLHLFSVYPNPFSSQTTLQTDNLFNNVTLTVYNSFGQIVKQIKNISGQTITLYRDNLAGGLYFIRLTQDGKVIATDKLVITD
ncbi:MAG: T9SS type A sorting domain-containing protein [Bacteroidetes bacterium]|nr:MAG: T9SS type A sorting domain-containing protein [Bacteroidota bacterium]